MTDSPADAKPDEQSDVQAAADRPVAKPVDVASDQEFDETSGVDEFGETMVGPASPRSAGTGYLNAEPVVEEFPDSPDGFGAVNAPESRRTHADNDADMLTAMAGKQSRDGGDADGEVNRFGEYELLEEIARGGMGVVWKARQIRLNRIVALKMILAGQFASEQDVTRFQTEAEAAASLDHPGIVPIFDVGEHDGRHYFSMGFISGRSLADRLKDGPLSPEHAAETAAKIAEAVAYAHAHGVIHRDLKPANILLDRIDKNGEEDAEPRDQSEQRDTLPGYAMRYEPKITDFGLAKRIHTDANLTGTGQILGTPSYMPPEQAAGRTDEIGAASDVYSVGAILYEMLTGRPPFKGDSQVDTIMLVLEAEPERPKSINPRVPPDLQTICMKCLLKDPAERYETAAELAVDLRKFLEGEAVSASTVNVFGHVVRTLARSRHEREFAGLSKMLFWFAAVVFGSHAAIQLLLRLDAPETAAYWAPRIVMVQLLAYVFWRHRPKSIWPSHAAQRSVWGVWIGYLLTYTAAGFVVYLTDGDPSAVYRYTALLSAMGFFAMGGQLWGGCYAIGLAFVASAPLLVWIGDWASLGFGGLWGAALCILGLHYRRADELQDAKVMDRAARDRQSAADSRSPDFQSGRRKWKP